MESLVLSRSFTSSRARTFSVNAVTKNNCSRVSFSRSRFPASFKCSASATPSVATSTEKFVEASKKGNLVPLYKCISYDYLTPVLAYLRLVKEDDREAPRFLFESVEQGFGASNVGRYSVVGAQPVIEIVAKDNLVTIMDHEEGKRTEKLVEDPLGVPRKIMEDWSPQLIEELPNAFCGGWVGYFSFDTVQYVEKKKLPFLGTSKDDRNLTDLHFGLYRDVIVFDHVEKKAYVIHWVRLGRYPSAEKAYDDGKNRLEHLVSRVQNIDLPRLASGSVKLHTSAFRPSLPRSSMTSDAYKEAVMHAKERILAGDISQIVLSQRFERRTVAYPFYVHRGLRIVTRPYMTYLQARRCIPVASSPEIPEILTRVKKRKIVNRPLAGTVRRGKTGKEELLNDAKPHEESPAAPFCFGFLLPIFPTNQLGQALNLLPPKRHGQN